MIRPIFAAALSASLALGSLAAVPVQAQGQGQGVLIGRAESGTGINNRDLANMLMGAAALAIVGTVISKSRKSDRSPEPEEPVVYPRQPQRFVPGQCLETVRTRQGSQKLFLTECLRRAMRHPNRLPAACAVRVGDRRHSVDGYDPQCLRYHGWRVG